MFVYAIVVAAVLATGAGISRRLHEKFENEPLSALEALVSGAVFGTTLWVAISWLLALTHTLTRPSLIVTAIAFVVAGVTLNWRDREWVWPGRPSAASTVLLLPVAAWFAFILWRAVVIPVVNHDALSYHLPKSVLFIRAAGWPSFAGFDHRFPSFPANYELLVADQLILLGTDRVTEWIGATFFLLFLATAALVARSWWGRGLHVAATVIVTAAAPVVLLHSGTDKNDLMTQCFVLTALLWGARWAVRGGVVPMVLLVLSVALSLGTKTNAGAVAIGLLPFLAVRVVRSRPAIRNITGTALLGALAFLACGGFVFVSALMGDELMGVQVGGQKIGGRTLYSYQRWSQVWEIPAGLLVSGLSAGDSSRDIVFSAHFGPLPSILALLLPFALWRYRREGTEGQQRERVIMLIAALISFAVLLPLNIAPSAVPRYALFLLPVFAAWTVAPAARELLASPRFRRYGLALLAVLALTFVQQSVDAALNDSSCPMSYIRWCLQHPGTRVPPTLHGRASLVVDRLAGPQQTVAFSGDVSSWIYPVYGARLTRPVVMLPESATAATVPQEADWVAIERLWHDGRRSELHQTLLRDRRFALVFDNPAFNRSAFRRLGR